MVAGALAISFSSGTMIAPESLNITWSHNKKDKIPFFLEKIKLDKPGGPGLAIPVLVANSSANAGVSSIEFERSGLFVVVAVNAKTNKPIFTTVINVVSPTSLSVPVCTSLHTGSTWSMSDSTSTTTNNHVAASVVAGCVAGGITGLVLLSITFVLCRRRSRRKEASLSLQIPRPFYVESNAEANGAQVSGGIKPTELGAQTPKQSGVGETFWMVTTPRIEEKQHAASRYGNGAYDSDSDIDGSVTEVSEQPPAYALEY
ncbi:hypothetical protein BDP27DRAFT_1422439 [Rhodocollybia butyracea]|uniref:Uncharacterized protein n=1 Tax=Rhodocollybia butyracea TaxID=206335 RepID=A0A9P5PTS3_9AGAR|nr:hypothetical protein BDP27DRAFT_1422439 [Rhodocollybia butyracea]